MRALVLAAARAGLYLAGDGDGSAIDPAPAAATELDPAEIVARVSGDFGISSREGPEEVTVAE